MWQMSLVAPRIIMSARPHDLVRLTARSLSYSSFGTEAASGLPRSFIWMRYVSREGGRNRTHSAVSSPTDLTPTLDAELLKSPHFAPMNYLVTFDKHF